MNIESDKKVKSFEDLWIWQQARMLVKDVYLDFGQKIPIGRDFGFRDFGFKDQIQKASVSIMNNIVEGFERASDAEFARFLAIAKGSRRRGEKHVLHSRGSGVCLERDRDSAQGKGKTNLRRDRLPEGLSEVVV